MITAFALVSLLLAIAGAVLWTLHLRGLQARALAGQGTPATARVSIVVPARNEAHNLPALLGSLARLDPAPAEIIVVDDHSTDGTGDLARAAGAIVVTPEPLPPGWMGKPWACRRGAEVATGELVLFTDADTVHAPDSLARVVAHQRATDADLVTVVPTHVIGAWWERLQGVFQLLLLIAAGRDYAIGQYLLFRRSMYDALGGHASVRDRVGEDVALLGLVRARGGRAEVVLGRGLLTVRMYPEGLRAFIAGWRRNFREGLGDVGLRGVASVTTVFAWLGGIPLFLALSAATGEGVMAAVLAGAWGLTAIEVARRQRLVGDFPAWSAPLAPLSLIAFVVATVLATFDRIRRAPVRWRGRTIAVRPPSGEATGQSR